LSLEDDFPIGQSLCEKPPFLGSFFSALHSIWSLQNSELLWILWIGSDFQDAEEWKTEVKGSWMLVKVFS
jgi:hypothetical protein